MTKCGTLVRVKMMMREFATSHATDGVDEVLTEQIFEPILIRVVSVGMAVEVVRRRVFTTLLITCILRSSQHTCNNGLIGTYAISFLVKHKRSNGPPGVCMIAGLTMDTNGGAAPAILILGTGDSARRGRH